MSKNWTGAEIRQSFVDFFVERGHTFVRSSSLVPGGDQTLLFTNAGMVQFKDVFLGTDKRPYQRAANSQKCMRVAGKHNDLDDVGRDDTHHTLFEMLGNWSFGDYYKKEAISWAWELLTNVWELDKTKLWTSVFKDDKGNIPTDEEAAQYWREQPGMNPEHVCYFGRKENFWEMAETGPCGPCSEIHYDKGESYCDMKDVPGHVCRVNGDCKRFVELWNLVFIQYNRLGPDTLEPLPATHVDTGMGLERIVSVMQGVFSNYRTDLLMPLMETVRSMTGHTIEERDANITPYRVIADHTRAGAFLIGDGVVPGNTGRNYVCRMIIRRAARFGSKIGLHEPFLARVAETLINNYGEAYPELLRNRKAILDGLTREEERFKKTLNTGLSFLDDIMADIRSAGKNTLEGNLAFDLYATHGLPLEITRDILRENGLEVDEPGFRKAMEDHRIASGAGKSFGALVGEDADTFRLIFEELMEDGLIDGKGVHYNPYDLAPFETKVLALVKEGEALSAAAPGDVVEVLLPRTNFYVESGGQVSDTGTIRGEDWEIQIVEMRKPAAGVIVHIGKVVRGTPRVGDSAVAAVDVQRRRDTMRNHTATHLMHAVLHKVVGEHARQAGSLVAPDRLRFDFTHPEGLTPVQMEQIEAGVNQAILENFRLNIVVKPLAVAMEEGAMALFGEKYGEEVRTIAIAHEDEISNFSYELCGGTHVEETGDIGVFLIVSEGSAAAGIRRIEAVTGRGAYELIQKRFRVLKQTASLLSTGLEEIPVKTQTLMGELDLAAKQIARLKAEMAASVFATRLIDVPTVEGVPVLAVNLANADADTLRQMADRFRDQYSSGVVVLGSASEDKVTLIAAVTDDLIKRGLHAGELVKGVAQVVGGSGGGRPNLAQAGGKDPSKLSEALDLVMSLVSQKLKK